MSTFYDWACSYSGKIQVGDVFGGPWYKWEKVFTVTEAVDLDASDPYHVFFNATVEPGKTIGGGVFYTKETDPDTDLLTTDRKKIGGRVTLEGVGLGGVSLGAYSTNHKGNYCFSLPSNPYTGTITPVRSGYTFTPENLEYTALTTCVVDDYIASIPGAEKPINPAPTHEEIGVEQKNGVITWEDGGGAETYNVYFGEESGNLIELITGITDTSWLSPFVVLEINDYNPTSLSGYRSPVIGDVLTLNDSSYSVWDIKKGHAVNGTYEAKLFCTRLGYGPGTAGDVLTNGVAPNINNPQAVRVTLNDSLFFTGDVESAFYPFGRTFYWRVDAVNEAGVTEGDEWEFTIFDKKPPIPSYTLIGTKGPNEGGIAGVDFIWDGLNNMYTVRRLIAAADNKIWYESI